jgi:hypothetical protein
MATINSVNTTLAGQTGTGSFAGSTSPTFVTPALGTPASGNLVNCTGFQPATTLIATVTAANSATIDLIGMTGFTNYFITFSNLTPVTNATDLRMRISTNNGSTFDATANYRYIEVVSNFGGSANIGSLTDTSMIIASADLNNTAGVGGGGILDIINPAGGAYTTFISSSVYLTGGGVLQMSTTNGQWTQTTTVNAIRFLMSSGNISTGIFNLFGVK